MSLINQTFDDRDTTHLKYQGDWVLAGSWNASNVGETGTLASSKDLNANVTFTFPTPAIAFYYYGIPRCCGGLYGICIDCDPLNPNFITIDAVNTTDDGKNPPIILYSATFKTAGIHEIIIRNENDTRFLASGNSQITLDRIDLEVLDQTATPSATPSTTTPAPARSPSSPLPLGAIIGIALAAVALLICVVVFAFWHRLRRRREHLTKHSVDSPPGTPPPMLQPFIVSPPRPSALPFTPQTGSASIAITSANNQSHPRNAHDPKRHNHLQSSSVSELASTSQAASQASGMPRRELDGGPLQQDDNDTLPPEYGQVFVDRRVSVQSPPSTSGNTPSSVPNASNPPRRRKS